MQDDGQDNGMSPEPEARPQSGVPGASEQAAPSAVPQQSAPNPQGQALTLQQLQQQEQWRRLQQQQRLAQEHQQQRQMMFGVYPGAVPGQQQSAWPAMMGRGMPMPFLQPGMGMGGYPGWGMPPPLMGAGAVGTFADPYSAPMGMMGGPHMDPMMAWYAMHYGQYAQAMQNHANAQAAATANAQLHAEAEQQATPNAGNGASVAAAKQNLRWWQDPEKVGCLAQVTLQVAEECWLALLLMALSLDKSTP